MWEARGRFEVYKTPLTNYTTPLLTSTFPQDRHCRSIKRHLKKPIRNRHTNATQACFWRRALRWRGQESRDTNTTRTQINTTRPTSRIHANGKIYNYFNLLPSSQTKFKWCYCSRIFKRTDTPRATARFCLWKQLFSWSTFIQSRLQYIYNTGLLHLQ